MILRNTACILALLFQIDLPVAATPPAPNLTYVDARFLGTRMLRDPISDTDQTIYPHSASYPISFRAQSKPIVALMLYVGPPDAVGTIQTRGAGGGLVFPEVTWNITGGGGVSDFYVGSSTALPYDVSILRNLSVNWEWRSYIYDEGQWTPWQSLGTTETDVYITLRHPNPAAVLHHSVMELACKNGGTTTLQIFNAVWPEFASRNVQTVTGHPLMYYAPGTTFSNNLSTVTSLLHRKTGQCFAWSDLLRNVLLVHDLGHWTVREIVCTDESERMVISNWTTNNAGSLSPPYPYRIKSEWPGWDMVPVPAGSNYGDLTSVAGVVGQQNQTPSQKVFVRHWIIEFNNGLYDPSYGMTYPQGLASMETSAVFGFATQLYNNYYKNVRLRGGQVGGLKFP